MLSNLSSVAAGLKNGFIQKILGLDNWLEPKLLPAPGPEMMKRIRLIASLEKQLPDYEFDLQESFSNIMICHNCGYEASHFLGCKNEERYQVWICECSNWISGPWLCPSENKRF